MLNIEHLLENAVCELEKHEVHEAYRQFMESPCNIELAENAGIRLDDVWVMAVYCDTTLRQDWKEKWEKDTVVHGKWKLGSSGVVYYCSNCCKCWAFPKEARDWNFCHNCGAKMDGGTP